MKNLNATILLAIECPSCLDYMSSPIYVCIAGHSICNNCWKDLDTCPTCRRDLSQTRNYCLETLAELLYYPCYNSEHGCTEKKRLPDMEDHLSICSFRNYKCLINGCQWEGRRVSIEDHFLSVHGDSVIVGPENWCWWNNSKRDIYLMLAHKEMFYVHRKIVKNYMYWVVQYIGKSEDVIQYYFQISVFSDQFQNRKLTISENCQDDIKDDISEIIDSGYAVGMPVSVLETYRNENGQVWYNISIHKA